MNTKPYYNNTPRRYNAGKPYTSNLPTSPVAEFEDFAYGLRAVMEAINAGQSVEKVLLKKSVYANAELMELLKDSQTPYQLVPDAKLNQITKKNHQGVIAMLAPVHFNELSNIVPELFERGETPLLLGFNELTDVRNVGAMLRTASCAGVHAAVYPTSGGARLGADAIKTSAGAIFSLPICKVNNWLSSITYLKQSGIQVVAASEKATQPYTKVNFTLPTAILIGSEEKGIHPQILKEVDVLAKIPIVGPIASLNASNAAAIMLFEAVRQRSIS